MLYSHIASTLRYLIRNRLYSGISIVGLALGMAAALFSALVVRNQTGYDSFIPGYQHIYQCISVLMPAGRPLDYNEATHNSVAALLKIKDPQITAATRYAEDSLEFREGQVSAQEKVYWADPDFFDVLRLPVLSGDLHQALRRPDGIVLTTRMAEKYFGTDQVIGRTIEVGREHTLVVSAVLKDPPVNGSQFQAGFYLPGIASYSRLTQLDADPANRPDSPGFQISVRTFIQLKPGAPVSTLQAQMPALMDILWPRRPPGLGASLELTRIDRVHLHPGLNPGAAGRLAMTSLIGAFVLLVAAINFVNLATARAGRRALEVGLRKAYGADRWILIVQFVGEAVLYILLSACLAMALVEWLLPRANAFLDSGATFDYWREPTLILWILLGAILLALIAGLYPAFILSSFHPGEILRGSLTRSPRAGQLRQALVVAQFAILIGLLIAAAVIYRQRDFATRDALRVTVDGVVLLKSPCRVALKNELQSLKGVSAVSCTANSFLTGQSFGNVRLKDGRALAIGASAVDPSLLTVYKLKPVAGRFFGSEPASTLNSSGETQAGLTRLVINQTAVRDLGFSSPEASLGQILMLKLGPYEGGQIIGVVPDFSLATVEQKITPSLFYVAPAEFELIHIKLANPQDTSATLSDIDRIWRATDAADPVRYVFLRDYIQDLYLTVLREAQAFFIFSGVAVLLACLGLAGLSAASTDRRIKEIGIRKAVGADTPQIVRMLVWQFITPILWASVIAWPIAAFLMHRWLEGFAYHVDLEPWILFAASGVAAVVALMTVSVHCYLVARAKPILALRYE